MNLKLLLIKILVFVVCVFVNYVIFAATKTFSGPGSFSDASKWNGGNIPTASDNIVILGSCTIDNNALTDNIAYGNLVLGRSNGLVPGSISWQSYGTNRLNVINISSAIIGGAIDMTNGGTLIINGTWSSTDCSFSAGSGIVEIKSVITIPTAYTQFNNLVVNSSGVVTVSANSSYNNITINTGSLSLSSTTQISIKGNFENNALFTANSSKVTFNGTIIQYIRGNTATSFYDLTINGVGVVLNQNTSVDNILALVSGGLDLNSKILSVSNKLPSAITRINGYIVSEKSHNASKISWNIGNNVATYVFPFRATDLSYIPFTLSLTSGDIGYVSVSTYHTDADLKPYPITPFSVTYIFNSQNIDNSPNMVKRYWEINKTGVSGTANLTFAYAANEVPTNNSTILKAQRWNTTTNKWDSPLIGQSNDIVNRLVNVPSVTNFSPWAIASGDAGSSPLPIKLLYLNSKCMKDSSIQISWATASETNNNYFSVLKSTDSLNWEEIGRQNGAGNSNNVKYYSFKDTKPSVHHTYYKIKQTDFDGKTEVFPLFSILCKYNHANPKVFPNPASKILNISFLNVFDTKSPIEVNIYDIAGKNVMSGDFQTTMGNNQIAMELPDLKPGIYFIQSFIDKSPLYSNKILVK